MSTYLNIKTNEYPRYEGDLAMLGWSLGMPLPEDWVEVEIGPKPDVDKYTLCTLDNPVEINGKWVATWNTREMTENEKEIIDNLELDLIAQKNKK